MRKIAVVGNSHLIAIHGAYQHDAHGTLPPLDFYYIPNDWAFEADHRDGSSDRLINAPARDSEDRGISLSGYDGILISALGWWAARNANIEGKNHPLAHMLCAEWPIVEEYDHLPQTKVSRAVFIKALEAWLSRQHIVRLANHVCAHYNVPVFLQPWPAPNRTQAADPDWLLNRWFGAAGASVWFDFFNMQVAATRQICEGHENAFWLDYPLPGPARDGFMAHEWCDTDPFHGNARYGELILQQLGQGMYMHAANARNGGNT